MGTFIPHLGSVHVGNLLFIVGRYAFSERGSIMSAGPGSISQHRMSVGRGPLDTQQCGTEHAGQ